MRIFVFLFLLISSIAFSSQETTYSSGLTFFQTVSNQKSKRALFVLIGAAASSLYKWLQKDAYEFVPCDYRYGSGLTCLIELDGKGDQHMGGSIGAGMGAASGWIGSMDMRITSNLAVLTFSQYGSPGTPLALHIGKFFGLVFKEDVWSSRGLIGCSEADGSGHGGVVYCKFGLLKTGKLVPLSDADQ